MRFGRVRHARFFSLLGLLCLAGTWLGGNVPAWALTFAAEEQLNLPAGQVIADSWYAAGRDVQIGGRINRDALVAGLQLNFNGTEDQDLMAVAQSGYFSGTIAGDLRAAGETLLVSSKVGQGAVLFAARKLGISPGAVIQEGLVAAARTLTVGGVVHGRTELFGDEVQLEGVLDGDVTVHCNTLRVGQSARVFGVLTYYGNTPVQMAPGAQARQVNWIKGRQGEGAKNWYNAVSGKNSSETLIKILFAVTFLLVGTLLVWVLPVTARHYAEAIQTKFWPSFGWGILILIGVPLLCLLFVLTLLGIPLAIVLGLLYLLGLFLSKLGVGYGLGRMIFRRRTQLHPIPVFLSGYALLAAVGFIPVFGSVVGWLAIIVGLGGLATLATLHPAPAPGAPASQPVAVPPIPALVEPSPAAVALVPVHTQPEVRPTRVLKKSQPRTIRRVAKTVRKTASRKRSGR